MSGFFEEVQRRKVYRVAAAYIIAAGFIIQIGSAVFPAWKLPNWTFRFGGRALTNRISDRVVLPGPTTSRTRDSGLRRYLRPEPTVAAFNHADCNWGRCFRRPQVFSFMPRVSARKTKSRSRYCPSKI